MQFEWDEDKNRSNQQKHAVSFETATLAFRDEDQLSVLDRRFDQKERWVTLGRVDKTVLYVAHTIREDTNGE